MSACVFTWKFMGVVHFTTMHRIHVRETWISSFAQVSIWCWLCITWAMSATNVNIGFTWGPPLPITESMECTNCNGSGTQPVFVAKECGEVLCESMMCSNCRNPTRTKNFEPPSPKRRKIQCYTCSGVGTKTIFVASQGGLLSEMKCKCHTCHGTKLQTWVANGWEVECWTFDQDQLWRCWSCGFWVIDLTNIGKWCCQCCVFWASCQFEQNEYIVGLVVFNLSICGICTGMYF